jgi:hypothetical protein
MAIITLMLAGSIYPLVFEREKLSKIL